MACYLEYDISRWLILMRKVRFQSIQELMVPEEKKHELAVEVEELSKPIVPHRSPATRGYKFHKDVDKPHNPHLHGYF